MISRVYEIIVPRYMQRARKSQEREKGLIGMRFAHLDLQQQPCAYACGINLFLAALVSMDSINMGETIHHLMHHFQQHPRDK